MDKKIIYTNNIQDKILLLLLTICTIFMSIGYATINSIYFDITGKANANIQDGVFIVDANYLSDTNADVSNSGIDNFYQSVLKSHITLSSTDETSTITYEINLHNSSKKDYIYIGTITDKEDITYYSNKDIDFEIPGLIENKTIIKGGQTLTFKYIENADIYNNNKLNSILNFRFKEIPILNLSNNNETYTLTNIYPDYTPQEYEFTISNYNQDYTNGIPMKYNITTDIEAPLTAKIYDLTGQEITGPIELIGNNSDYVDQTYILKITWDNSNPEVNKRYNSYEYAGRQYDCNINVVAIPDDSDYKTYTIENSFKVNITTADFNFNINPTTTIGAEKTSTYLPISISNYNSNSEYNIFNTVYQISLLNNDKFNLEVDGITNNTLEKELKGNEKLEDNFSIKLLSDIYNLSENETITLTINSIAPYYKENTYTITIYLQKLDVRFDANGGSVSPTTLTTYKGRTYGELPTPTWIGHTFNGWYTSSSGGTQITSTTEATTGNSTQTLYANWTSRLLSDKVKPGDLVNYDVGYSNVTITFNSTTLNLASGYTGWKVLDVVGEGDDKYVLLITSGIPLSFRCPRSTSDSTNGQKCQTALTTDFFSTSINSTLTNYKFYKNGFTGVTTIAGLKTVFSNNKYTQKDSSGNPIVRASTKTDIDGSLAMTAEVNGTETIVIENLTDFRTNTLFGLKSTSTTYSYVPWYIATTNATYYLWSSYLSGYVVYTSDTSALGVRPVVALKSTTETTGQSSSVWQLSAVSE